MMLNLAEWDGLFTDEERQNTPARFARFVEEWTDDQNFICREFDNDHYDGVVIHTVPFYSLCAHHLLPFFGKATLAYIPADKMVGISKLARFVNKWAHRPQSQERLTAQIAGDLQQSLETTHVAVHIVAEHFCEAMRGVRVANASTITTVLRGAFFQDPKTRSEFLGHVQ